MNALLVLLLQAATPLDGVGVDQNTGRTVHLNVVFLDEKGTSITLRQAAGKVFVLAPVYYRCPQLCTLVLNGLLTSLKGSAGRYQVVTFSFDPSPALFSQILSLKHDKWISTARFQWPGRRLTHFHTTECFPSGQAMQDLTLQVGSEM